MDFSLNRQIKLTKNLILSKITQEQIFYYYIGSEVKHKKLFRSKLRTDRNVTCSIYKNKNGDLIYKDFATDQHLNCFAYVMELFKCDYQKALHIIANDFNIISSSEVKNKGKIISKDFKIKEKEFAKLQAEIKDFDELELKWWNKYGITLETLKKFNVFSIKHVFLNGQIVAKSSQSCPIYGYYGNKLKKDGESHELWKFYFPKRRESRFLGNYPAEILQGYKKLPKNGKICVITKSMKDVMALYEYGIPACAPNGETVIPKEAVVKDLLSRFDHVFALWDCDHTGVTFLNKIKRKYPELKCLIIPRKLGAKDFSDLREKYGYKKTKQFIIDYLNSLKNGL